VRNPGPEQETGRRENFRGESLEKTCARIDEGAT
jgi:hypothetical protein